MSVKLSLVIPVYNAELFIFDTLTRIQKWKQTINYKVEVIFVNDGSLDNTNSVINSFIKCDPDLKLLFYKLNQGKGFAVKAGMLQAKGDFKIFTDADIPYGFSKIDEVIYYLDFKEFDVCIGNRNSKKSDYFVKMSVPRKLSSKIFTFLYKEEYLVKQFKI